LWIQSVYRDYLDDLNPGIGLAMSHLAEFGKQPGAGVQVIQVITVDALDPQPVGGCRPGIAHAHSLGSHRSELSVSRPQNETARTARAREPSEPCLEAVRVRLTASAAASSQPAAWPERLQRAWSRQPTAQPGRPPQEAEPARRPA